MTTTKTFCFAVLELAFVASALMSCVEMRHDSIPAAMAATLFLLSGAILLVWSIFLHKQRSSYALIAWITLFVAFVVGMAIPKL